MDWASGASIFLATIEGIQAKSLYLS